MSGFRISRVRRRSVVFAPTSLFCSVLILTAALSGLAALVAQTAMRALPPSRTGSALPRTWSSKETSRSSSKTVPTGAAALLPGGRRSSLLPAGAAPSAGLQTGMRVRSEAAAPARMSCWSRERRASWWFPRAERGLGVSSPTPPSNTFGAQRTAVLSSISPITRVSPSRPGVRSIVFTGATSASNFDLENSYGQTWLTGDVFGFFHGSVQSLRVRLHLYRHDHGRRPGGRRWRTRRGSTQPAIHGSFSSFRIPPPAGSGGCPRSAATPPGRGSMETPSFRSSPMKWDTTSGCGTLTRWTATRRSSGRVARRSSTGTSSTSWAIRPTTSALPEGAPGGSPSAPRLR